MKRYLNVTLHAFEKKSFKLGLVKILGSCDANMTKDLVSQKLGEFGLELSHDIFASTHDGAAVMRKYGSLISAESQLCYNHGIHLAVVDVFYKDYEIENEDEFTEFEVDSDCERSTTDNNSDSDDNLIEKNKSLESMMPRRNINSVLQNVRKLVRYFKYSFVKNCILQEYVKKEFNQELKLLLDCKTRWNSIIPMIERILKLRTSLKKALTAIGNEQLYDAVDFDLLLDIINVLKPLELAVLELGKEHTTLITAEATVKFI